MRHGTGRGVRGQSRVTWLQLEKGSGPNRAKHPSGRLRLLGPDPFSSTITLPRAGGSDAVTAGEGFFSMVHRSVVKQIAPLLAEARLSRGRVLDRRNTANPAETASV